MMTHELGIMKDDPAVKSVNKDMTKFMTNPQDLNQLQEGMSDEQKGMTHTTQVLSLTK